jgi:Acetyltransferase (GNAT) family.
MASRVKKSRLGAVTTRQYEDEISVRSPVGYAMGRVLTADAVDYYLRDIVPEEIVLELFHEGETFLLDHLEVKPSYRGQGYGRLLAKKILKAAKKAGADQVLLNASPIGEAIDLSDLIKMYESLV